MVFYYNMLTNTEYWLIITSLILGIFSIILAMLWKIIKNFFHNNYSYFDFIFIIAYFLEQLLLIILLIVEPEKITFLVSVFALLVVTTASVQKFSLDSKDRRIREVNIKLQDSSERKNEIIENLGKQNKDLSDYINKLEKGIFEN